MKTPAQIQEALKDKKLSTVAKKIGVSYSMLWRMATYTKQDGELSANPAAIEKVEEYLTKEAQEWLA